MLFLVPSPCCCCFRPVRRGWCWRSVMAGWTWFGPCWLTGPTSTSRTTRAPRRWCAPANTATWRSSNCCWLNPGVTPRSATTWVTRKLQTSSLFPFIFFLIMSTYHGKTGKATKVCGHTCKTKTSLHRSKVINKAEHSSHDDTRSLNSSVLIIT